jgi:hypothetical protein
MFRIARPPIRTRAARGGSIKSVAKTVAKVVAGIAGAAAMQRLAQAGLARVGNTQFGQNLMTGALRQRFGLGRRKVRRARK